MAPVSDEIRAWLNKASSDLLAAQILIKHSTLALGPAAFHCQQTAEKVLTAFLIFKAVPFDRVHNLVYQEAHQALAAAQAVWNSVLNFLPCELHPSIPRENSV